MTSGKGFGDMNLKGKVGLITGIANGHSVAAGCARAMAAEGAQLACTYLDDRTKDFAGAVFEEVGAALILPLDVRSDEALDAVFAAVEAEWGRLDFLLHSIAFCRKDDLHGPVVECSRDGFAEAMDISCHSLIRMAHRARPLMREGGSIITVTYHGADQVVDHYNIMGPVKAALESSARYLAAGLGAEGIRVNAISPGPISTRAASGIDHFSDLIDDAVARAPEHKLVTVEQVGALAAFLAGDAAAAITGGLHYVDGGFNIIA